MRRRVLQKLLRQEVSLLPFVLFLALCFTSGESILIVGLQLGLVVHFGKHVPDVLKFRFRREVLYLVGAAQLLCELIIEDFRRYVFLPFLRVLEHIARPVKPSFEFILALEESSQFHKNTNNCVRCKLPSSFSVI